MTRLSPLGFAGVALLFALGGAAQAANPLVWFQADALTGAANGGSLSAWPDSSGNGFNATQATSSKRPTYVTHAMNGQPVVRFNPANNTLLAFPRPVQDDFTIICAFQSTQGLGSGTQFYQGAGLVSGEVGGVTTDFGTCLFANGAICAGTGQPDVSIMSGAGFNDGQPHILAFSRVRSTGIGALYVDGVLAGTVVGSTASLTAPANLTLGAIQTGNNFLSGDIAEVQVYSNALSVTDLLAVENGLFQKYGLVPSAPAGLALQLQEGHFRLSWLESPGAANYHVKRATTSGGTYTVIATNFTLAYTDTDASPLNVYYYVVSAVNTNGESADSIAVSTDDLQAIPAAVWFKAEAISAITNGGSVAAWPDSSGNGFNATQATSSKRPTYVTHAMNGRPVVRFNPANNTLLAFPRPVQDDFTIICAFQSTQGLGSGTQFYQGAGLVSGEVGGVTTDFGTCLFANGAICAGTGQPDVSIMSGTGFNDGQPHILAFSRVRSTGIGALYVDGVLAGTVVGSTASLTAPANLTLGAIQTGNNFLSGDIAEVMIYANALSGTDLFTVQNALFFKYNFPPAPPAGLFLQLQGSRFTLNWLASPGAVSYNVKRSATQNGTYAIIATSAVLAYTDTNAQPTDVYYYVVSAVNTNGESANSMAVDTGTFLSSLSSHEVLGPSSRKTPIAISEIMYKPAPCVDGKNLEFIEIYNSNPWFHDLSGYRLTCADMSYKFPPGSRIAGNSFIVIAPSPADVQAVYGLTNVMGPYTGSLKKAETLELLDEQGAVLLTVPYSNIDPWPVATDRTGHSLVLANPTYGEGDPRAWDISEVVGGSPGRQDLFRPDTLRNVVINEILAHSETASVPQFVELYNHSNGTNDLSGCILTDDPRTNRFVIPAGTLIGPGCFVAFNQVRLGFTLNGSGETLYFIRPDGSRVMDAVQFPAQADGVSYGRWPDGANDFYSLVSCTPGTNNSAIWIGDIVINELMYNPLSGNDDDQYIELYNKGTNAVNLANWQFTAGVSFTFPSVTIAPKGYLVVARNLSNLLTKYANLTGGNTVGNFGGKLSHNGERVTLSMPQLLDANATIYVAQDEVTYGTGGRWGQWASGGGSSLELMDPRANHRLASNWADSDESQKSVWTNCTFTGTLDNGFNFSGTAISHAQIGILDVGECLVDNVEVLAGGSGTNTVLNPDFETGLTNWTLQGDQVRSSWENSGYLSAHSLHVRCSDRYWLGVNSCQANLGTNSLVPGGTATLRFKARWLHGWPEVVLRLNGGWLEATGALPVPPNPGTPGMPNSTYIANVGPAIYRVTHSPALPSANQPAMVTACVHDPDGAQNLTLNYRLDPATNYTSVPMTDDGSGGDAVAGDGVFSASIPGQTANALVAYYISATDSHGAGSRFPGLPNNNSPVRECLVMFGDGNPGGSFSAYHLWITQSNITRWSDLGDMSNEGIDCTMVNGKRIIYNLQAHFAGSPVHQSFNSPSGNLCHYKWVFNDDDRFLGATSFNKIHQPGNTPADDASLQREQLANTFLRALGVPWLNRRYVAVYLNGNRRGSLMEDAQTPDSDMVKEYFPNDTDGYLYKVARWYEFAPFLSGYVLPNTLAAEATLMPYTTTGGTKKVARYRFTFESRRTPDSANNYTNVFSLIDAASSHGKTNYLASMENMADMENWMRVFAANHAAGNWDAFGAGSGQNVYSYLGTLGAKWSLMMFDFNIGLGNQSDSWLPGQNLFTTIGSDPNMGAIYSEPAFRRMYWRALQELLNVGPLNLSNSAPLMDAKYVAFVANGISVEDPNTRLKGWISQAQSSIAAQLAAVNATNFSVDASVTVSNHVAVVTGLAPVDVANIWFNGARYPLIWRSLTNWSMAVPLHNGTNQLTIVGAGRNGQPIAGDMNSISVISFGGTNNGTDFPSSIPYPVAGSIYTQDFNALPNPGAISVNTANPVTINGVTYSFPNPYDFAFPAVATGNAGGLGLPALAGWFGLADPSASIGARFGATYGDQTTGGQLSFGPPNSSNRALGLLATSTTGFTAFGARFINQTTNILNTINLQFTGEVWRQSDNAKTLEFHYLVDLTGTNTFSTNTTAFLPGLDVRFSSVPADVGGVAVDGTAPDNQTNLSVFSQTITNWPPAAALWLVWEMSDPAGKAQGLAIDNLSFSAWRTIPNTPPALLPIGDRILALGQTLAFIASATDTDQPPQNLKFSLGASASAGAAIDANGGQFLWTPLNAPATNRLSIIVTDNGIPSLSATQTFTVVVLLPPQLSMNFPTGDSRLVLSWPLWATNFSLYSTMNLAPPRWSLVTNAVQDGGTNLNVRVPLTTDPSRFFRLQAQ